jgi:hypothetical protein
VSRWGRWRATPRQAFGREAAIGVAVAAGCAVLGAAAGLVWAAVAARIPLADQLRGKETADKALIGQDLSFAAVTAVAGVVAVALVLLAGRWRRGDRILVRGPGAAAGLALGGIAGSVVAAVVGRASRSPEFTSALARLAPHLPPSVRPVYAAAYAFQLRAAGLVMVWPVVALLLHLLAVRVSGDDH